MARVYLKHWKTRTFLHLADVNFWLALTFEAHSHHTLAMGWFGNAQEGSCVMCRLAQNGFLRLATNPAVFGEDAVTMSRAWELYDAVLQDERVTFHDEPPGLEPLWRDFTSGYGYSTKLWSDAYLAAFAAAAGIGLVSFDRGFEQYLDITPTILRE